MNIEHIAKSKNDNPYKLFKITHRTKGHGYGKVVNFDDRRVICATFNIGEKHYYDTLGISDDGTVDIIYGHFDNPHLIFTYLNDFVVCKNI